MNQVIDFNSAKERLKKVEETEECVIVDEDSALQFAIMIAADIGIIMDDMGLPLENDIKSMGDMYLIIDVVKAMLARTAGIPCDAQKISEMLINIDHQEHIEKFREIMESEDLY